MLVLTRKPGERLVIGDNIVLTVISVRNGQVRLGLEAPRDVPIRREELLATPRVMAGPEEQLVGSH